MLGWIQAAMQQNTIRYQGGSARSPQLFRKRVDLIELIHFLVEKGVFTIHSEFSLALQNDQKKVSAKSIYLNTLFMHGLIDHIQIAGIKN